MTNMGHSQQTSPAPGGLLGTLRLPFLVLTPACVLLGVATAQWRTGTVDVIDALLALFGALAAHISVNAFNEYLDFRSGLDAQTRRTPFSGGSGVLPARPELAGRVLAAALFAFALSAAVGLYFLVQRGMALLPLGLLGLFIVAAYTSWITRRPLLYLIAPGLGFGPLMVMGTDFVLTGSYSMTAAVASLVPFFLVNNLLLLNQFPDVEADRRVGRRHLPLLIGRPASSRIYVLLLLLAYSSLLLGVGLGVLPAMALLGLLTLLPAIPTARGIIRYADELDRLLPYMAANVGINIATPLLVAIGLLVGQL
ncbi:MAG: prenyltransferase [Gammaproteobacteria bacterium]|nr:prenyltransferase [Gammaproteobacteria bacterium]MCF6361836.1 prenyltransferase [Gammaproteobacteria bacterium]